VLWEIATPLSTAVRGEKGRQKQQVNYSLKWEKGSICSTLPREATNLAMNSQSKSKNRKQKIKKWEKF